MSKLKRCDTIADLTRKSAAQTPSFFDILSSELKACEPYAASTVQRIKNRTAKYAAITDPPHIDMQSLLQVVKQNYHEYVGELERLKNSS